MIVPHKYLNLDLSVLNIGGTVLSILKKEGAIKYDELLDRLTLKWGSSVKDVFIPALSFLYVLGKIEYRKGSDIIEFVE